MITPAITNSAKREFLQGVHQPGDVYNLALYDAQASLSAETQFYSTAGEVIGEGYIAGGKTLTGYKIIEDDNAAILTFDAATWASSTIRARGALIYNASRNNRALATYDFGREISSLNNNFEVEMPAPTKSQGVIRIA